MLMPTQSAGSHIANTSACQCGPPLTTSTPSSSAPLSLHGGHDQREQANQHRSHREPEIRLPPAQLVEPIIARRPNATMNIDT